MGAFLCGTPPLPRSIYQISRKTTSKGRHISSQIMWEPPGDFNHLASINHQQLWRLCTMTNHGAIEPMANSVQRRYALTRGTYGVLVEQLQPLAPCMTNSDAIVQMNAHQGCQRCHWSFCTQDLEPECPWCYPGTYLAPNLYPCMTNCSASAQMKAHAPMVAVVPTETFNAALWATLKPVWLYSYMVPCRCHWRLNTHEQLQRQCSNESAYTHGATSGHEQMRR